MNELPSDSAGFPQAGCVSTQNDFLLTNKHTDASLPLTSNKNRDVCLMAKASNQENI